MMTDTFFRSGCPSDRCGVRGDGRALQVLEDRHCLYTHVAFHGWQRGRKQWVMEHFYRASRHRIGFLMAAGQPVDGQMESQPRQSPRLPPRLDRVGCPNAVGLPPMLARLDSEARREV